ncbi:MAG: Cgl0159 family (beta/alpha)8-fold protein [Acidimicrobiia bacterium]
MILSESRFAGLTELRARNPELVAVKAADRQRRSLLGEDGNLMIIAADHPGRRILRVGTDEMAMSDRYQLLERVVKALRRPGVDGLLATPDIVEDLLLLDELENKIVFGSMNRGGLTGSAWELDDRFTGYTPSAIQEMRLEGGKMLLRLDYDDKATIDTIEACARAITELAARSLPTLVEPLPVIRDAAQKLQLQSDPEALIGAITVASALGTTSAYTWLKVPTPSEPERVFAATTLPCLLLGGDPGDQAEDVVRSWKRGMAVPNVRGLVVGRSLLYPRDGDVLGWVDRAAEIVHAT